MNMIEPILSGNILWSFDFELQNRNRNEDPAFHFTGIKPFHCHDGEILLTDSLIQIIGADSLTIPLGSITQLYLGFDDIFPASLSKNFGMFWQPLRLTVDDEKSIYLIIDFNFIGAKNKLWYDTLVEMLTN